MLIENNAMTFTNRLNYAVSEVPREEFLEYLSSYGKTKEDRLHARELESKFIQVVSLT